MRAMDIMTREVVTVRPKSSIHEAARRMIDYGVSGLPVVDDSGRVIGIISEGDLILRQKPRERVAWWRAFFEAGEHLAREYQKAAGETVGEVMTPQVITVSPELPMESVAVILDEHRIRRVPVLHNGRLVGIVSRGDLIKALANEPARTALTHSDTELITAMRTRLAPERWAPRGLVVQAKDGVLSLWGLVATEAEKSALETMARSIEGVKDVDNQVMVRSELPYWYGSI
jgi:CBS domain-containing protein